MPGTQKKKKGLKTALYFLYHYELSLLIDLITFNGSFINEITFPRS